MSNLKSKLKKMANSNTFDVRNKIGKLIEDELLVEMKKIGWTQGTDGVLEEVDGIMDAEYSINIDLIATAICSSIEEWAEETKQNYSEELDNTEDID